MKHQKLSTIGLFMPENFPTKPYETIHAYVVKKKDDYPEAWTQFAGGWKALAYRFMSFTEHNNNFTSSVKKFGDAPVPPERYVQEKELFAFFVNGLSAIESLCYAMYAVASIIDREHFSIKTEKELRSISPERTKEKFINSEFFRDESISNTLKKLIDSQNYQDLKEVRNILAHRVAPGRIIFLSGGVKPSRSALWIKGIQIDENTTSSRYTWLTNIITDLLNDLEISTSRLL